MQQRQIIAIKPEIIFNQTCHNEWLYRTFTNIYIYIYIYNLHVSVTNLLTSANEI